MVRGRGSTLGTGKWKRIRLQVLARDGHECQLQHPGCTQVATEADHIVPRHHGGEDHLDNLRASCKPCNSRAGARLRWRGASSDPGVRPPPLPSPVSLAEPLRAPQKRRTHREVPE